MPVPTRDIVPTLEDVATGRWSRGNGPDDQHRVNRTIRSNRHEEVRKSGVSSQHRLARAEGPRQAPLVVSIAFTFLPVRELELGDGVGRDGDGIPLLPFTHGRTH